MLCEEKKVLEEKCSILSNNLQQSEKLSIDLLQKEKLNTQDIENKLKQKLLEMEEQDSTYNTITSTLNQKYDSLVQSSQSQITMLKEQINTDREKYNQIIAKQGNKYQQRLISIFKKCKCKMP
jgi:hypothetical protein